MWQPRVAHWGRVRFLSDWQSHPATLVSDLEALGYRLQQHTLHAQNDSLTSVVHRFFVNDPWEIDCHLREQARLAWRENTGAAKKGVRKSELLYFDSDGLIDPGEAIVGAVFGSTRSRDAVSRDSLVNSGLH